MNKLYAAYGSNLNLEQMAYRCPNSIVHSKGVIEDYKLKFSYHLDIVPSKGDIVPILLWDIADSDWAYLDMYEGVKGGYYKRENVKVKTDNGEEVEAIVYVMCGQHEYEMPSESYWQTCEQGYMDCGFAIKYLNAALVEAYTNVEEVI